MHHTRLIPMLAACALALGCTPALRPYQPPEDLAAARQSADVIVHEKL